MSNMDQNRWSVIKAMMPRSKNVIEEVQGDENYFESKKDKLHLSDASLLGSFFKHVGGLSVNKGQITILGSNKIQGVLDVFTINEAFKASQMTGVGEFLVIGYDWAGGLFALNLASSSADIGNVCYFSKEDEEWMDLEFGIDRFFNWLMSEDIDAFYEDYPIPMETPSEIGLVLVAEGTLVDLDDNAKIATSWLSIFDQFSK